MKVTGKLPFEGGHREEGAQCNRHLTHTPPAVEPEPNLLHVSHIFIECRDLPRYSPRSAVWRATIPIEHADAPLV